MVHFYIRICTFLTGIVLGVLLAIQCKNYGQINPIKNSYKQQIPSYNSWVKKQSLRRKEILWDVLKYSKHNYLVESQFLYDRVKVFCIILVRNIKNTKAVENTWGRSCNEIKFLELTPKANKTMSVKRTKENSSWVLLCNLLRTFKYSNFEWFLIVRDTTFVIVENLRYYVAGLNSSRKYYLGHAVSFWNTIYNSGDAGYVLSKGSLTTLIPKLEEVGCFSNVYWNREDFYLGKYLSKLNITPIDTRDHDGLSTFHPYNWYHLFFPGENYYKTSYFPVKCCSKQTVTFHAVEGDKMYTYYYLLYTLQIFLEGKLGNTPPPTPLPEEKVWKQFLRERNIPSDNMTSMQYYKIWEDLVDDPNSFAAHMKKEVHFDYD